MKCTEYRSLIDAYIDDALDARTERQFTAHGESCAACRQELRIAKKIRKTLSTLKAPSAPRDFEARVKARIKASEPSTFAKIFMYPRYIKIPLAAAAMIAITLSVMFKYDVFSGGDQFADISSKSDFKIASAEVEKKISEPKEFYALKRSEVRRAVESRRSFDLAKDSSRAQSKVAEADSVAVAEQQPLLDVEIVVASNSAAAAGMVAAEREKQKEAKADDLSKGPSSAVAMRNEEASYDKKVVQKSAPAPTQQQKNRALQRSDIEQAAKGAGGRLNATQGSTVNIQIPGNQLPQLKKELSNYGTVKQKSGKVNNQIVLEVTPAE